MAATGNDDGYDGMLSEDELLSEDSSSNAQFDEDVESDMDMDEVDSVFGSYDEKLDESSKSPYHVEFQVYSQEDIIREQSQCVQEVTNILGLPQETISVLLRHARWNKERLIEQYMDRQEQTLRESGLSQSPHEAFEPQIQLMTSDFVCDICCEAGANLPTFSLACGHRFCRECYSRYLRLKIVEEGEAARLFCPGASCKMIVDSKSVAILVKASEKQRYDTLLVRSYVDDRENLKWCPAPNCEYAIKCQTKSRELEKMVPTVTCKCGEAFCFGCGIQDHQPGPCWLVKQWLTKCQDDSETANWISAHTKECPKCHSTIEKNGGCNHMTCRKCRYEFCWMCMGVWSEHGNSWYNCNRYEEKSGSEARDAQARSRQCLERYLHYYNRYANHEQSAKLDKEVFDRTQRKMQQLQTQSGLSWIEVQFLEAAWQALSQCRRTLKWTYAFAFYLAPRNNETHIFEHNQRDLELAVENLSEMLERPCDSLTPQSTKLEIMDKTAYCNARKHILLTDTAKRLRAGLWEFTNYPSTSVLGLLKFPSVKDDGTVANTVTLSNEDSSPTGSTSAATSQIEYGDSGQSHGTGEGTSSSSSRVSGGVLRRSNRHGGAGAGGMENNSNGGSNISGTARSALLETARRNLALSTMSSIPLGHHNTLGEGGSAHGISNRGTITTNLDSGNVARSTTQFTADSLHHPHVGSGQSTFHGYHGHGHGHSHHYASHPSNHSSDTSVFSQTNLTTRHCSTATSNSSSPAMVTTGTPATAAGSSYTQRGSKASHRHHIHHHNYYFSNNHVQESGCSHFGRSAANVSSTPGVTGGLSSLSTSNHACNVDGSVRYEPTIPLPSSSMSTSGHANTLTHLDGNAYGSTTFAPTGHAHVSPHVGRSRSSVQSTSTNPTSNSSSTGPLGRSRP